MGKLDCSTCAIPRRPPDIALVLSQRLSCHALHPVAPLESGIQRGATDEMRRLAHLENSGKLSDALNKVQRRNQP